MPKEVYCDIVDVCEFLAKHRMAQFTSYGMAGEYISKSDGTIDIAPSIKPTSLFRGQNKAYETLRPTIYRGYPALSTWQEKQTISIDGDSLVMPHPHYCQDLERDYYFSCIKAAELITEVKSLFPEFPGEVDGHALSQHYGLRTHCLDFSEDIWISGFFASHSCQAGAFSICKEGIGVVYVLEVDQVPPKSLYEIGFQPLPRPFAQRGSLLKVPPDVNLLSHPAVWAIHFRHSEAASKHVGSRFDAGKALVPHDKISLFLESRLAERSVTISGVADYVGRVPPHHRSILRASIGRLFLGSIPIV